MANPYIDNAERWLAIAETDYLIMFVKAWIPFNAWYKNSYPSLSTDRGAINEIKSNSNLFRDKLISLLNGDDTTSLFFQNQVAELHLALESNYVPNASNRITFKEIAIERNIDIIKINTFRGWNYKVELNYTNPPRNTSCNVSTLVTDRSGTTKYAHTQNKYHINDVTNHLQTSSSLNPTQIQKTLETYEFINPKKSTNLIAQSRNGLNIGSIKFINNIDKITKGIIEVLYKLRCILFHGELNPSKENQKAYKPAYYILKTLIMSLK